MAGLSVDASEMRSLASNMDAIPVAIVPLVSTVVRKVGFDVQSHAQRRAPVDTGNLKSSISMTFEQSATSMHADIGPTAHYGKYVELGTSRMAPQPYMRPALESNLRSFDSAIDAVISRLQL